MPTHISWTHTYLPCPNHTITLLPASPEPIQQYAYLLQPTLILWRPSSLDPTDPYHTHSPCLTCSSMTQTCLPQPNLWLTSCLATTGHITPLHISLQQPQHAILLTPALTTSHLLLKGCCWSTKRCQDSWPPEKNSTWGQRGGLIVQSFCVIKFY